MELVKPEELEALQARVAASESRTAALEHECKELGNRLYMEFHVNQELIDLCRESGVKYRAALDRGMKQNEVAQGFYNSLRG